MNAQMQLFGEVETPPQPDTETGTPVPDFPSVPDDDDDNEGEDDE